LKRRGEEFKKAEGRSKKGKRESQKRKVDRRLIEG